MRGIWKFESRPEPGEHGQRFFTRVGGAAKLLYVCDNSGRTPEEAEDGPLYIDSDRQIFVAPAVLSAISVNVPVLREPGSSGSLEVPENSLCSYPACP